MHIDKIYQKDEENVYVIAQRKNVQYVSLYRVHITDNQHPELTCMETVHQNSEITIKIGE